MQFDLSRWKHFTAMAIIGDGIMGMIDPRRDARAWHYGPEPWRNLMQSLEDRPNLTRAISAAQVVGGILWVLHSSRVDGTAKTPSKLDDTSRRLA
ncbi:MAG: hypothetical protein JST61_00720 [Acidobacteria bacterium]|nr:hypothetical protein [Acidobacteriota bacterium]